MRSLLPAVNFTQSRSDSFTRVKFIVRVTVISGVHKVLRQNPYQSWPGGKKPADDQSRGGLKLRQRRFS